MTTENLAELKKARAEGKGHPKGVEHLWEARQPDGSWQRFQPVVLGEQENTDKTRCAIYQKGTRLAEQTFKHEDVASDEYRIYRSPWERAANFIKGLKPQRVAIDALSGRSRIVIPLLNRK